MSEPSYYPLQPLNIDSLEPPQGTISPTPRDDSAPSGVAAAEDPPVSLSSKFRAPLRPKYFRNGPPPIRRPSWQSISTPLEMALLPLIAIGYLAFCYTVHDKAVPVDTYGLYAVTANHFATIKGGVTTISIILISIALFPIYTIISDLKSEEFFRVLSSRNQGVPLKTVNHISNPTFGNVDMMTAVWNHHCSNHYILAAIASLLVWIVSTLAPGALTINSVLSDGDLMAFAVGAVPIQSVLNGTSLLSTYNASLNTVSAASIAWAEMELGVQYSFGVANASDPDYAAYIVPSPIDLSTTTSARWLSDVIGINPTCSWASTNLTTPVLVPFNSTDFNVTTLTTAYLPDFDLDVKVEQGDLSSGGSSGGAFASVKSPQYGVSNHSTQAYPSGGSTVFLVGQCTSGCEPSFTVDVTIDMSTLNTTFTINLTDQTWTMAVLACVPNIAIETREVRNDGHGVLTVQPRPSTLLTRQGNLDPVQTTAMFSFVTLSLTQSAGPLSGALSGYSALGSLVQGDLLYGHAQFQSLPPSSSYGLSVTLGLAPIANITQGYTQVIQSGAKAYLAGYLGTAYVPGRISASEIVFAASIPNLAVATAVFVLLVAVIVVAHFRVGKGNEFTLVNVAAAVHESELPALFARAGAVAGGEQTVGVYDARADVEAEGEVGEDEDEDEGHSTETPSAFPQEGVHHSRTSSIDEGDIVEMLGDRLVFMQRRPDGSSVLHISQ